MNRYVRAASLSLALVGICGALALANFQAGKTEQAPAARSGPSSVSLSNEFNAQAEVVTIDKEKRTVTLRREDTKLVTLQVGPAARNFDQIVVGDQVRVRYKESLTASLRPAGDTAKPAAGAVGTGRTEAGAKPGGGVGVLVSARVKIESIDVPHDIVVFSLASGELVAHRLATPEGKAFATGLKVGDVVQLDYAEGMALSVDKV